VPDANKQARGIEEQSRNSPSWRKKSAEPIKIGMNKAFNKAVYRSARSTEIDMRRVDRVSVGARARRRR